VVALGESLLIFLVVVTPIEFESPIMNEIEIDHLDFRFENLRLKDKRREESILTSILNKGVRDPLQCVKNPQGLLILLDGFKRLRCCRKLGLLAVPVVSIGKNEATGILELIRLSNANGLTVLEQAALVDELKNNHGLRVSDIALHLECSLAWVSVRLGIIKEMSPVVKDLVFTGCFPARSYMYTLRRFMRVKKFQKREIDVFTQSVSGKGLSTRDIETLAYGYFQGGLNLKEQIQKGNLYWTLDQIRNCEASSFNGKEEGLSLIEQKTIKDLEQVQKYMERVSYEINDPRLKSSSFFTLADLLVETMLTKISFYQKTLQDFYDQRREKKSHSNSF